MRSDVYATIENYTEKARFQPPRFEARQRAAVGDEWR